MKAMKARPERLSQMYYTQMESPVGPLLLAGDRDSLRFVSFGSSQRCLKPRADWTQDSAPFREVLRQLRAYFESKLKEFDLPLTLEGTEFQRRVWTSLLTIPYGETISYAELAQHIGNPKAVRAVGLANGSNPIPIIIPCHRVIGSNGSLTGFGGGLDTKKKLLALESKQISFL